MRAGSVNVTLSKEILYGLNNFIDICYRITLSSSGTFFLKDASTRIKCRKKIHQIPVFDKCLDVLYQNLFFGAITVSF